MIEVRTLREGGQTAAEVAGDDRRVPRRARSARSTWRTTTSTSPTETAAIVGGAIRRAHERGVAVRIAYNVDHRNPIPVPPPPEPDATLIASLGVPHKPISGVPDLMHHKYVVRDGEIRLDGLDELDGRLVLACRRT